MLEEGCWEAVIAEVETVVAEIREVARWEVATQEGDLQKGREDHVMITCAIALTLVWSEQSRYKANATRIRERSRSILIMRF